MEHIDKKALNLEMLKIAGFTCSGRIWTYPDGVDVDNGVPFFPGSLDECIKWIVPKLDEMDISFNLTRHPDKYCVVRLFKNTTPKEHYGFVGTGVAEVPALAFCLAVSKLK